MIEWQKRYSQTEEPDDMGRWARVAYINGLQIGWMSVDLYLKKKYEIKTNFPAIRSDTVFDWFRAETVDECKEWLEERWNEFLERIRN